MSDRMTGEQAREKLCPYTSRRCMADRCMKWHQVIPGSDYVYGYCSVDAGRLKTLEKIEALLGA